MADAHGSGPCVRKDVGVQLPPCPPWYEGRDSGSLRLAAADHVGRPVSEVAEELTALGLVVELKTEITTDQPRDRVTGISPTGRQLRAGDVVVVRYAVPPARPAGGSGSSRPSAAPVPEVAPDPSGPAEVETVVEPDAPAPTLQAGTPGLPTATTSQPPPSGTPTTTAGSTPTPSTTTPSTPTTTSSAPATTTVPTGPTTP